MSTTIIVIYSFLNKFVSVYRGAVRGSNATMQYLVYCVKSSAVLVSCVQEVNSTLASEPEGL